MMETTGSAWAEAQAKLWEQGISPLREIMESALSNDRAELSHCGAAVRVMLEAQIEQAQRLAASLLSETGMAEEDAELRVHFNAVMDLWKQVHGHFWDLWLAALGATVNAPAGGQLISRDELRAIIGSWTGART